MPAAPAQPDQRQARVGVAYGIGAYAWWGLITVVYFKVVKFAGSLEVVSHRIVWSVALLGLLITLRSRWSEVGAVFRRRSTLLMLAASSLLLGANWLLFIHVINTNQVMQASLGYFINPLLSVLLGFLFLGERLRSVQVACVLLACASVIYLTVATGTFPALALSMAGSFAVYGLLRKVVRVEAMSGLLLESLLLLPVALAYLGWLAARDAGHFGVDGAARSVLLFLAGPVTAIPLIFFIAAARRLRLATIGFLQYLAPTGQFLLAVFAYGEPFDARKAVAFAGIWTALALYTFDAVRAARSEPRA